MSQATLQGFKLSPQQRRWWTLRSAQRGLWTQAALDLTGKLDPERFRRALASVVERHESLRMVFAGAAVLSSPLQSITASGLEVTEGSLAGSITAALAADRARNLDFERGPLGFCRLLQGLGDHWLFLFSAPSLLADSASMVVLFAEIARSYEDQLASEEPPLQYLEFSEWQNELLESGDDELLQARTFWSRQELPARDGRLMGESPQSALEDFAPDSVDLDVAEGVVAEVERAAAALGVAPRLFVLAAWTALIFRLTGREAPVVGVTFEGRKFEDLEGAIGPFSRVLPFRVRTEDGLAFSELVRRVSKAESELRYWQEYAPWDLGLEEGSPRLVYPTVFAAESWPEDRTVDGLSLAVRELRSCCEPFRFRLAWRHRPGCVRAQVDFDSAAVSAEHARELGASFITLLRHAARNAAASIPDLEVLDDDAFERLVVAFNQPSEALAPSALLLHERFSSWAVLRPEAPAVVDESRTLTRGELEARADQLAHYLRSLGAGPELPVALWLDRSAEIIVALLAVLKSGAAYLPLDPTLPPERLALMVEEAAAPLVITQAALAGNIPDLPARVIVLEQEAEAIARCSSQAPETGVLPENLAYILFTSGSTGRPKGVAVEHRQVTSYLDAILARLEPDEDSSYAIISTFAADLGNTSIFPALATGGCLHVIGHAEARNPEALAARFAAQPVDVLKIVPSHLEALLSANSGKVLPRRRLVIGGEAASQGLLAELRQAAAGGLRVLNHYGPTETTVGVMTHPVSPDASAPLPLGRPLANSRIYLLDGQLRPVPVGMPGEIFIGGEGVSRGYLGRPDLTAERFVPDPFGLAGGRLYRSGDLARFRPGGQVELIGRADHQVKIRGYRIELAEVEATLRRHPAVREAVALVREDRPGERRLVGYMVPLQAGQEIAAADLRSFLARWLPEPMIPAVFRQLAALPLTANGKVDRAALPAPERLERSVETEGPRNSVEEKLAEIWCQVLGVERVGIHDNFFELGGDSILVIQVVARAGRAGLRFQPKQMFERQTIADLAPLAESPREDAGIAGYVSGDAPLTPIEHWFFEQAFADPHHWNQAALYEVPPEVRADDVRRAFAAVYAHHDALRLRFEESSSGRRQRISDVEPLPLEVVDLPTADVSGTVERLAAGAQQSLNLVEGPLVRAIFMDGGDGRSSRLLLVFHHLVIDGVSWRILIEDFIAAYQGSSLPEKTTPFLHWAGALASFTENGGFDDEIPHWESFDEDLPPFPQDMDEGGVSFDSERSVTLQLGPEETTALLQEVPSAYRTQINDVLLAALARVLGRWSGSDRVVVDLEGHGREDLLERVDLTRTVGWFTTHFPVLLQADLNAGTAETLLGAKEALRALPRRGIGFGALKYLRSGAAVDRLRRMPQPAVSFNYLGQFDQPGLDSPLFTRAAESAGPARSPRGHRTHLLGVSGRVEGGALEITWKYSANRYRRETVEALARGYLDELRHLIDHCRSPEAEALSPTDFDLVSGLSREQLERIARQVGQAKV